MTTQDYIDLIVRYEAVPILREELVNKIVTEAKLQGYNFQMEYVNDTWIVRKV